MSEAVFVWGDGTGIWGFLSQRCGFVAEMMCGVALQHGMRDFCRNGVWGCVTNLDVMLCLIIV